MDTKLKESIKSMIGSNNIGVLFDKYNIFYCTETWVGDGCMVFTSSRIYLLVGSLEYDFINDHNQDSHIEVVKCDGVYCTLAQIINSYKIVSVFTDTDQAKTHIPGGIWASNSLGKILRMIRQTKNSIEIANITDACAAADTAFARLIDNADWNRPITERQLSKRLEQIISELSVDKSDCDIMVHSGVNTSYIHSPSTDKFISQNDLILIDFGVKISSYQCDFTRMISLGKPESKVSDVYNTVLYLYNFICKEITSMNPFELSREADKIAEQASKQLNMDLTIDHALGHGIGLEVHESPTVGAQQIRDGMTLAIEPGFYIKNEFGVRLENDVVIENGKCRQLNKTTNEIIVL